ncbi:SCO3242 family prenyltransferase [Streptomyces zaehneri]|uniref:SCO3242 family prenyltransferase n=1 Tax=Streptomyces zaehneri TaxID=3051180 RepID=UPI0028D54ACE|nr:UbiA family prenyltransferase [Streptomyces sp. DSM 40713]
MSELRDWAELLRVSALFTVPGDALAGAAATGRRPGAATALAAGASLCLYEAGMALNDWADRDEDAAERPHRPVPSGRIAPGQALAAAAVLTGAGLGLGFAAGRPTGWCATALAGTVWAYDLRLKHTAAGPAAMASARGLDLLMGAVATAGPRTARQSPSAGRSPAGSSADATVAAPAGSGAGVLARLSSAAVGAWAGPSAGGTAGAVRRALLPAAVLGAHTYALTTVSRAETRGGARGGPLAALGVTAVLGALVGTDGQPGPAARWRRSGRAGEPGPPGAPGVLGTPGGLGRAVLAGGYAVTAGRPLVHAVLNPSPQLTQRAVGGGIRALIPLQAALAARSGSPVSAALLAGLVPVARRLARKVSPT